MMYYDIYDKIHRELTDEDLCSELFRRLSEECPSPSIPSPKPIYTISDETKTTTINNIEVIINITNCDSTSSSSVKSSFCSPEDDQTRNMVLSFIRNHQKQNCQKNNCTKENFQKQPF